MIYEIRMQNSNIQLSLMFVLQNSSRKGNRLSNVIVTNEEPNNRNKTVIKAIITCWFSFFFYQTLTISWKLEEKLSSAHNSGIPLNSHASLLWIRVYTWNEIESKWCASCLISLCHRLQDAVGEGRELAHSGTVIPDTWPRCQAPGWWEASLRLRNC